MKYDMKTGAISAVTEEIDEDSRWTNNIIQAFIKFLTSLFRVFAKLLSQQVAAK